MRTQRVGPDARVELRVSQPECMSSGDGAMCAVGRTPKLRFGKLAGTHGLADLGRYREPVA